MSPRRIKKKAAGNLSLLGLLIAALEEEESHDRPNEALALRAFGELALKQVPARGVFSPAEGAAQGDRRDRSEAPRTQDSTQELL